VQFKHYNTNMLQVTTYGWNVGAQQQQQQQVCTTLSAIFFLFPQFLIRPTFNCVSNDDERGGNCLLVPERSYGPVISKWL